MKTTDIKMHVLKTKVHVPLPLSVTTLTGGEQFGHAGPAEVTEFSLVRVLTDERIEGHYITWSEMPAARPGAMVGVLRSLKSYLIGKDPFDRETFL